MSRSTRPVPSHCGQRSEPVLYEKSASLNPRAFAASVAAKARRSISITPEYVASVERTLMPIGVESTMRTRSTPAGSIEVTCAGSGRSSVHASIAGTSDSRIIVVLPEPETPVTAVSRPRGIATSRACTVWIGAVAMRSHVRSVADSPPIAYWPASPSDTASIARFRPLTESETLPVPSNSPTTPGTGPVQSDGNGGITARSRTTDASRPVRNPAMRESWFAAISSGVPWATTRPPSRPAPGPISMNRSAARSTRTSWSTNTTELPASSRSCMTPIRPSIFAGCRPVLGSSSTYSTPVVSLRTARASCARWRSPVDNDADERSNVRYPNPSCIRRPPISSSVAVNVSAISRISAVSMAGTPLPQSNMSRNAHEVTSARPYEPMRGARAASLSRVPPQSGQVRSARNFATLANRFSSTARSSSFKTVRRALRNVKSRSCTPFIEVTTICFFSSGPLNTISRSASVSSRNGTFVRTPNSRTMSGCTLNPNVRHGTTAPSSMLSDSSGTRVASSTSRTMPVPWQRGQAPVELNAKSSAPGGIIRSPHSSQNIGDSAATAIVGAW